jgi:hypothetical protein
MPSCERPYRHLVQIGPKSSSSAYKSLRQSKPITSVRMVTSNSVLRLRASATLFSCPALCFREKVNLWMKDTQRACIRFTLFWLLMNCKAWWSLKRINSLCTK